jgi:hypothetical protein
MFSALNDYSGVLTAIPDVAVFLYTIILLWFFSKQKQRTTQNSSGNRSYHMSWELEGGFVFKRFCSPEASICRFADLHHAVLSQM